MYHQVYHYCSDAAFGWRSCCSMADGLWMYTTVLRLENCRKGRNLPDKSSSWAENISRQSEDELPSSWWTRWCDIEPRQRDRLRRCPRGRSSMCSRLVAWTIGVWCRVFVCITMLCSYCTTSFIESHGRRLRHKAESKRTQQQTLTTCPSCDKRPLAFCFILCFDTVHWVIGRSLKPCAIYLQRRLIDWVKVSTSHQTQNRSFQRRSSQPISWVGTEKN